MIEKVIYIVKNERRKKKVIWKFKHDFNTYCSEVCENVFRL